MIKRRREFECIRPHLLLPITHISRNYVPWVFHFNRYKEDHLSNCYDMVLEQINRDYNQEEEYYERPT